MIINTHSKTCYQQQRLESTNSNQAQKTSGLATLLFLCSMMVDEHITLFLLLSDCLPDNQNWYILNSWNHFEITLQSSWNHLAIILQSSWNHLLLSGLILDLSGQRTRLLKIRIVIFWCHRVIILHPFRLSSRQS